MQWNIDSLSTPPVFRLVLHKRLVRNTLCQSGYASCSVFAGFL